VKLNSLATVKNTWSRRSAIHPSLRRDRHYKEFLWQS
jgi:hypothetical protein